MGSVEELYQEIILEHNKRPRNYGLLAGATHTARGENPLCGDELQVQVLLDGERLRSVHFQAQGCAISKAAASMMTEAVSGKSVREAVSLAHEVIDKLKTTGGGDNPVFESDLDALLGVRKFPARVKCATLAWHALISALEGGKCASSETTD